MNGQKNHQEEQDFLQRLQEQHEFKIMPCEANMELVDKKNFEKLNLTSAQKMQISELLQHVPTAATAGAMAGAYTVSFPSGLPHTLMALKQGGFGSAIMENGKIVGMASFSPMLLQTTVLAVFTAMSIATGQFFLTQINRELHMINKKLDEILKFLYEEKKAELLSEVIFIKYACDNYNSIMVNEAQRAATIVSIQEAKKIAMKDIEFYLKYLDGKIKSGAKQNFKTLAILMDDEIIPNKENLDMSLQLYLMSSLMEVYYAQNYEKGYISYVEESINSYVENCSQQKRSIIDKLEAYFESCKILQKDTSEFQDRQKRLGELKLSIDEKDNDTCKRLYAALHTANQSAEYYIMADGNVYYKAR